MECWRNGVPAWWPELDSGNVAIQRSLNRESTRIDAKGKRIHTGFIRVHSRFKLTAPRQTPNAERSPNYCVVSAGRSGILVTGGGFHLPVSASDFGA